MDVFEKVKSILKINNKKIRQQMLEKEIIKKFNLEHQFIVQTEEDKKIEIFNEIGINKSEKRNNEIVISMTCMPGRFHMLKYAIYSLMNQTKKPDRIILTLSSDELKESEIPDYILKFQDLGLTIQWIKENIKRDKKLFPLFEKVEDNTIILFGDDDLYYNPEWLKTLYQAYLYYNIPCYYLFGRYENLKTKEIEALPIEKQIMIYKACNRSPISIPLSGLGMIMQLKHFNEEIRCRELRKKLDCENDDEFYLWLCAKRSLVPLQKIAYNQETKWVDIPFLINKIWL